MKKIIIIICFALVILLGSCGHETAVIRKNYVCHRSTISENRQLYDISAYSTGNTMSIYYATYSDGSSTIHQQVTETGADSDTENMTHNEFTEQALFTVEGEVYQIAATADSVWVLTVLADPVAETSGGISIYGYCLGRYDLAGNLLYETEALSGLMKSLDDYSIITMQPDQKGNIVLLGNGCGIYCFGEGTETAFTYSGLLVATGRTMKDEPIICLMEEDQAVIREVNVSEQKCKKIGTVTESLAGVNSILQTGKNKYALLTTNDIGVKSPTLAP